MSELAPLITDLGIILVVAGCVMILFKWLKQPVILGYIVAGFITGPSVSFLPTVSDTSDIKIWADIGVIFLLFAMGLEFSFRKLLNVGLSAMVATVTIVCGMMFLGYVAGNMMGFSHITSLFLGGMLSMSSTAIVFKAFNDMNLLQQKFTGIVLGILVVEDLVGVVMLVVLSTLAASSQFEGTALLGSLMKLVSFLVFWSVLGIYLLPTLINRIKRFVSDEILLVVSLGLCLLMVMIAVRAGFSSALGAFVMGSLLAETSESERISRVVQPVKDLFAAVFFVSVGMMIDPMVIRDYIVPILLLTLLVLAGQSFFGTFGVLLSGQPLKLAMKSGFSLTQVGEFAFIIASLGVSLKVTDTHLYPIIVAVSVITTFCTPYMIRFSEPAYRFVDRHLPVWGKQALSRYVSGSISEKHQNDWHRLLRGMIVGVSVYLVLCIGVIVIFFSKIHPFIQGHLPGLQGDLLGALILLAVLSPLLWAMVVKKNHSPEFRRLWADNLVNRGALSSLVLIKIILCITIVMSVVVRLFNVASGLGLVIALLVVAGLYFSKRIRKRSLEIEEQFEANFQGPDEEKKSSSLFDGVGDTTSLSDLHAVDFTMQPNSVCVGKTLKTLAFRTRYRVNIITIGRGDAVIDIPQGDEMLYPYDKITVVGTDEDLSQFARALEQKEACAGSGTSSRKGTRITNVCVDEHSSLLGKSVGEVKSDRAIILGVERGKEVVKNPSPAFVFQSGDIVWMVASFRKPV